MLQNKCNIRRAASDSHDVPEAVMFQIMWCKTCPTEKTVSPILDPVVWRLISIGGKVRYAIAAAVSAVDDDDANACIGIVMVLNNDRTTRRSIDVVVVVVVVVTRVPYASVNDLPHEPAPLCSYELLQHPPTLPQLPQNDK